MPSTRRAPLTSTSSINNSSTDTNRVKATNSTRSQPTKSQVPWKRSPKVNKSSLPILNFKGKQTTSARISYSQKHHSNNCNYLETIFDTVSDESILAALTDVVQDQDLNTTSQSTLVEDIVRDQDLNITSQSTLVEDEDSEDEPLIRRPRVWKNISNPEPTLATQLEDKARDDQERPLTQVIPTASQSPSSSYPSTMLDERTPPIPSTTRLNTTSRSMVVVCPNCLSKLSLKAALELA
ncbi:MAG: hypothetical protein JOS17DRAFT_749037 [Linnemannia elongata]|nr:MAG: hypothetical protein JOS17DRAFT_749037 [Linnemannia elongata]